MKGIRRLECKTNVAKAAPRSLSRLQSRYCVGGEIARFHEHAIHNSKSAQYTPTNKGAPAPIAKTNSVRSLRRAARAACLMTSGPRRTQFPTYSSSGLLELVLTSSRTALGRRQARVTKLTGGQSVQASTGIEGSKQTRVLHMTENRKVRATKRIGESRV